MGAIKSQSGEEFAASFKVAKPEKPELPPSLGPEFIAHGAGDALIHDSILDNPKAAKSFQASAIHRAVARGMSLASAQQLYGNHAAVEPRSTYVRPRKMKVKRKT